MVSYRGMRGIDGRCRVIRRDEDGETALPLRLDLAGHSPTGFEWGYCGSGPAQLALAILADCLPDDTDLAYELHQTFKFRVVGSMPKPGWFLDQWEVNQWIFAQLDRVEWRLTDAAILARHVAADFEGTVPDASRSV